MGAASAHFLASASHVARASPDSATRWPSGDVVVNSPISMLIWVAVTLAASCFALTSRKNAGSGGVLFPCTRWLCWYSMLGTP